MAKFTDLSNELILAVRSHLRKPSDILRFALSDRRCYGLITPLLYRTITLHHKDYRSIDDRYSDRKIQRKLLEIEKSRQGRFVRNLEIVAALGYDVGFGFRQLSLFRLLPHLTNLTSLHMSILQEVSSGKVFPLWLLPAALGSANGTLRRLVLCIEGRDDSHLTIGSLQRFVSLKHLCIQSSVLLGASPSESQIETALFYGEVLDKKREMASQLLPASLESLELHCCRDGDEFTEEALTWYVDRGHFYASELSVFVGKTVSVHRRLAKSVVVCRSVFKGSGKRVRDLRDRLDVVGTKTSHFGVELKLASGPNEKNTKLISVV